MDNSAAQSRVLWLVIAFPLLAVMVGMQANPQTNQALSMLLALAAYFMTMIAYFGLGRLALAGHTRYLVGAAAAGLLLALALTGQGDSWPVLMGLSAVLAGGVLCGRFTQQGQHPRQVYVWSMLAVAVLSVIQLAPLWSAVQIHSTELIDETIKQFRQTATLWTTDATAIDQAAGDYHRIMKGFIHILPAMTLLSCILQFTVGYLLLSRYLARSWPHLTIQMSMSRWRMPFGWTALLVAAVGLRLTGHELTMMAADNLLVLLAIFYAVCGLALVQTYLRRLTVPVVVKVMFWVLLFLTHLIGLSVIGLLGFIDSFVDFRRRAAAEVS